MASDDPGKELQDTDTIGWPRAIGPNADRYMRVFDRIAQKGGGWVPGWNMAAFLHSTGWFCYRRMYGFAFINLLALGLLWINELFEGFLVLLLHPVPGGMLIGAYGLIAFVVVPVFADSLYFRHLKKRLASACDQYENGTTYGPSKWTEVGAAGFGIVWVLGLFLLPSYVGYTQRVKISKAIVIAGAMKTEVAEFYHSEKRLPTSEEAKKFRNEPEHSVARIKSLIYDGSAQMVVITMRDPFPGKQFAMHVEIRDGALVWTCRTIDLHEKYLPASCRN